ncbi:YegS/Rv2252/BmrU family lipid kinase [Phycicoccus sp. M110.8]|uniref:diacylglycerol/lipid kinase family protein n=1 Tax=Phycicoccus sp. M110.8 TaxID=3075433 RepID=UPI0028FD86AB|nr:YegS/Rv2252/BmrU family lipid kinase [Phycicoccus sp. M110.8]MDU0315586.1 YegS/Rv2252/BmrU family lipid kinase [Phycicoccus sp. M110.8]
MAPLPAGARRVGLVVNPTSGKNRGMSLGLEVAHRLRAAGHEVLDLSDETYAAARDRALGAIAQGLDVLAVVGGDGMVHLGVNLAAETKTPLAVIAAGTGNDVARGLGLPVHDPVRAADLVTTGVPRSIDAVRHVDVHGVHRWYAGVLGAGFDSLVNERANTWPWPKGQMRYNLAILRELPLFHAIPYAVTVDGVRQETRAMLVVVANGPSYGGGMRVAPDARFDDGLADVVILHEISTLEFLKVFPKVFSGRHLGHPAVEVLRGREVTLEADGIVAYADGERFAPLPLTLETVPGALTVLTPPAT